MDTTQADSQTTHSDEDFIDIGRILHILNRRRSIIFITTGFFVCMAFLYLLMATSIYTARSVLEMHTRRPMISGRESVADDYVSAAGSSALNTEFHKLQSHTVREKAATELRKSSDEFPLLRDLAQNDMESYLYNIVSFEWIRDTYLIEVSAETSSRDLSAHIANIYAETIIKSGKDSTRNASLQAVAWLQEQIDVYEAELLNNEAQMIAFEQKNGLEVLRRAKTTSEQALLAISAELVDQEIQSTVLQDMSTSLTSMESSPEASGILPSSIPRAAAIQQRLKEYTDANSAYAALSLKYTDKHPIVVTKQMEVEALRKELIRETERAKQTALSDLALTRSYVKSIAKQKEANISDTEKLLQTLDRFNTEMIPMRRGLDASSTSYRGLLNRIEQAKMASDEYTSMLTIHEYARRPARPVRPKKKIIMLASLILGCGIGACMAFLVDVFQDRICTPDDIETDLRENLLGIIPAVDGDLPEEQIASITMDEKFGEVSEAMAIFRSALISQRHHSSDSGWILLATSGSPSEGKSTVSCNLAITMSRTGKKVLLIDGDMRKPRLHKVFEIPMENQAMMEVLASDDSDEKDFSKLPHQTNIANLEVTLGHAAEGVSPIEVLETGVLERFLAWAREHYDIIIIDSPPAGILSDAMVYGRFADDVIVVARQNRTRKGLLRRLMRDLRKNSCNVAGVVLNDFNIASVGSRYGGTYGNYGSYGYGQRYESKDNEDS